MCPLNITTQLAPRDMRGREEAHAEKNKGTAVEYELLDMYSPFPFINRHRHTVIFSFNLQLYSAVKKTSIFKIPTDDTTKNALQ
jgi:hypothetical protein